MSEATALRSGLSNSIEPAAMARMHRAPPAARASRRSVRLAVCWRPYPVRDVLVAARGAHGRCGDRRFGIDWISRIDAVKDPRRSLPPRRSLCRERSASITRVLKPRSSRASLNARPSPKPRAPPTSSSRSHMPRWFAVTRSSFAFWGFRWRAGMRSFRSAARR